MTIDLSKLYLIEKRSLVKWLFYTGMLIAYITSLNPWFLWWFVPYYPIVSSFFLIAAMVLSSTMTKPVFTRNDFLLPLLAYIIIINNIICIYFFHIFIFYSLFRYDSKLLFRLSTFLAKAMACLLAVSIPFFILYILGFPLPYRDLQYRDAFYTFSNYFFFLIDDRQLLLFFPRFQSVFLEPAHLGTAIAVLLQAQRGHWRKWYNIILLSGLLISFSLGAYVYLVVIIILNLWTKGRKIFINLLIAILVVSSIVVGSFYYNDGENLIHNLIVLRLEIDEGEMAGNHRTSEGFDADFENFLKSSDILFGREKENVFGDSGYKVYIYDYGFVGAFLLFAFYISSLYRARNKRAMLSALIIAILIFGVDAFVLWYNRFIPLFCAAYSDEGMLPDLPPTDSPQNT